MPDTSTPYHIAYVAIVVLYGGYASSIWLRARRVLGRSGHPEERSDERPALGSRG
jgi:hypothetical protein